MSAPAATPHRLGPIRGSLLLAALTVLPMLLASVAIVLPWTLRNISLYGDPFASASMRTAIAHLLTDRSLFSR